MNKKIMISICILSLVLLSSCTPTINFIACFFLEDVRCPIDEIQQCYKNIADNLCISYGLNTSTTYLPDRYTFYCSGFTREHGYNNQQFSFTHEEVNKYEEMSK